MKTLSKILAVCLLVLWAGTVWAAAVKVSTDGVYSATGLYGNRIVVRTASKIYVLGGIRIYMSSDNGATWTRMDSAHEPTSNGVNFACAINSAGKIGVVLHKTYLLVSYITFDTSSDTWDNLGVAEPVAATTDMEGRGIAIAFDSSDKPHVVYCDQQAGLYGYYTNKVGASWSTPLRFDTSSAIVRFPDIAIDSDNLPIISYTSYNDCGIMAVKGNANNATSFGTRQLIDDDGGNLYYGQSSLVVDASGNHHIAYTNVGIDPKFIKIKQHNKADAWTTWSASGLNGTVDSNNYYRYLCMAINGTTRYIIAHRETATAGVTEWTDASASWSSSMPDTGAYYLPRVRWSYLNNPSYTTYGIDYVFVNSADGNIYWNKITLTSPINTKGNFFQFMR